MKSHLSIMAESFKALGDENRLKLLETLSGGEMFAGELLDKLSIAQPTLSHHMKILCDSGIVEARREGKWIYYKISETGKMELIEALNKITSGQTAYTSPAPVKEKKETKPKKQVKPKKEIKEILEEIESYKEVAEPIIEEVKNEPILIEKEEEKKEEKKEDRSMPSWLF